MAHAFQIKQFDQLPTFKGNLVEADGSPIDLRTNQPSLIFAMRASGGASPIIATGMTILDATAALVEYAWGASQTATVGWFQAEVEITYVSTGKKRTVPNADYFPIRVVDDIA